MFKAQFYPIRIKWGNEWDNPYEGVTFNDKIKDYNGSNNINGEKGFFSYSGKLIKHPYKEYSFFPLWWESNKKPVLRDYILDANNGMCYGVRYAATNDVWI